VSVNPEETRTVLVVGADGTLGRALAKACEQEGDTVLETTRRPPPSPTNRILLDLSQPKCFPEFSRPLDITFVCAGATKLAACEQNPIDTTRVNVDGTVALVQSLLATGSWIVFLSTNLVFDGSVSYRSANDLPCPTCEYGRQKASAEKQLLTLSPKVAVLRLSKVVDCGSEPFSSWFQALSNRESVEAFTDKVCAPLSIQSTVSLLLSLARKRAGGLFQASASHDLTYAEAAALLAQQAGAHPEQVLPVRGKDRGIPASFLPRHTTLEPSQRLIELGWTPPDPKVALLEGLEK
jgi:dTDP-4-dehydrorhamnose reductase